MKRPTTDDLFEAFQYRSGHNGETKPCSTGSRLCSPIFWMEHRLYVRRMMRRQHPNRAARRALTNDICQGTPP